MKILEKVFIQQISSKVIVLSLTQWYSTYLLFPRGANSCILYKLPTFWSTFSVWFLSSRNSFC